MYANVLQSEPHMNFKQNYFESAQDKAMANEFHFSKSLDRIKETEQISTVKSKKFSFLWTINNFKEFIDRQYEFTSPEFFGDLSSKWRMMVYPVNIYPEGIHVALRLLILSEIDSSYSVMYKISFLDDSGKQHMLKTREKVFRRSLDFDECPIVSNICMKKNYLLGGESLTIRCELDLLECENLVDMSSKPYESLNSSISRSCEVPDSITYQNEKINIPSMVQSMNNLSYSEPYKNTCSNKKIANAFKEKDSSLENYSGDSEISNCKVKEVGVGKGLEILSNDLKQLYYNTNQHDVVIYTDDGKCTAHEIILTSRSEYFKKALSMEKKVHVPIINLETVEAVLYYLYTGKLKQMTEDSAINLIKASKLLELPDLENMTTETCLSSSIRVKNVTKVFLMAKELKIESLKNYALKFMAENCDEITKTGQWNELMNSDPHTAGEVLLTIAFYQKKVANHF